MQTRYNKTLFMTSLLTVLSFAGAAWAAPATPQAVYMTSAQLQAYKSSDSKGLPPIADKATQIFLHHQVGDGKDGEGDLHTVLDVFYVATEGHADVITGGKLDPTLPKSLGDEEMHGPITGGHIDHMSPGDIIWIPKGTPHQINIPKGQSFTWLAFRGIGMAFRGPASLVK